MKEKAIIAISCLYYVLVQSEQFQCKYSHPLPKVVTPDSETAFIPLRDCSHSCTRVLSLYGETTLGMHTDPSFRSHRQGKGVWYETFYKWD